jgi:hypothetical protein
MASTTIKVASDNGEAATVGVHKVSSPAATLFIGTQDGYLYRVELRRTSDAPAYATVDVRRFAGDTQEGHTDLPDGFPLVVRVTVDTSQLSVSPRWKRRDHHWHELAVTPEDTQVELSR